MDRARLDLQLETAPLAVVEREVSEIDDFLSRFGH
jgi:hypothetical protein